MEEGKKPHGFAAMSPQRRQEIARRGAAKLRESGRSHQWTSETAREASKRGLAKRWAAVRAASREVASDAS